MFQVGRQVREPQLRVLAAAWQRIIQCRCLRGQQDQGAGHDLLPARVRRGGVAAGPLPVGTGTAAAAGDPVGVHDVRVARVGGQRLLPSAGRSAMALGLLDLPPDRRTGGAAARPAPVSDPMTPSCHRPRPLAGIAIGTVFGLATGDARPVFVEGSVPTAIFGLVCVGSLWSRRPHMQADPGRGSAVSRRRSHRGVPNQQESASRSAGAAVWAGSPVVAAQAMWASGRISRASAGR